MKRIILLLTLALGACSGVTALDGKISEAARNAEYPGLLPIDQILATGAAPELTDKDMTQFNGRVQRLKARAARLRRTPVVDGATRTRLYEAIRS